MEIRTNIQITLRMVMVLKRVPSMKKVSLPFIEFAGAGIHEGIKYRSIVVRRWKSPRL